MYRVLKLLGALSLAVALSACSSSVKDFNITVQVDSSLKDQYGLLPSFEVDVLAINADQEDRIKSYNINEYFEYQNPLRMSLPKLTLKFSEDGAKTQVIDSDDPAWEAWASNKAEILVLIANLPYVHSSTASNEAATSTDQADGRRLLVPMKRDHWYSLPTWSLYFLVTPSGLVQLDKPKDSTDLLDTLKSIQESDAIENAVKAVETANQLNDTAKGVIEGIKALK